MRISLEGGWSSKRFVPTFDKLKFKIEKGDCWSQKHSQHCFDNCTCRVLIYSVC